MDDTYSLGTQDGGSDFGQLDLHMLNNTESALESVGPFLHISEQPKQRGFRFRYGCEGPSHGGLPGASSEKNRKTYPTIKILNYTGNAKIVVQLVTAKDPPKLHAHSLVGKQCTDDGVCIVQVGPKDMTAQFTNLGILHVTKKNVPDVLFDRLFNEMYQRNPLDRKNFLSKGIMSAQEIQQFRQESEQSAKEMDLSVVRLQFTAYLPDSEGMYTLPLEPVVSDPIFDSKAPNASNLKIVRMDKTSGCVTGGDEIYLLCDKVQKDDIQVRFYEDDDNGWEAYGDFGPTDVHRQFAIVFRTPRYWNIDIEKPITVFVQLKRRKDGETSEAKAFTYCPRVEDKEEVHRKRLKRLPHFSDHFGGGSSSGGATGFGGRGGGGGGYNFNSIGFVNSFGNPHCTYQQGMQHAGGPQGCMELTTEQGLQQITTSQPRAQGTDSSSGEVQQITLQPEQFLHMRALQITQRTARALLDYAITGDVRMLLAVQRHLTAIQDENGDTSLHLAIIHQQPLVVQQLLQVIVSIPRQNIINIPNDLRQTPLHLGVITQQHRIVELLLTAGANATILDRHGNSILHLALHRKDEKMVELLLEHLKPQALSKLLTLPDCNGLYPVHLAVKAVNKKLLQILLNKGADKNIAEQKSGRTPLHLAVEIQSLNLAGHLLLEAGVEIDRPTFEGNTALHLAAGYGLPALTAMLLTAGADQNAENYEPILDSEEEDELDQEVCHGHTPFDITVSEKVRDILLGESWKWKETNQQSTEGQQGSVASLGPEALEELNKVLNQEVASSDWVHLAEKLNLGSLSELLKTAKSPSKSLLDNFDISGGTIEQLVNALQCLGLEKAVNIIQKTETYKALQSSDGKQSVDSAYESGSQKEISPKDNLTPTTLTSEQQV
ncbi:nuclear factor NF-kappa-B p100 subunit-like [Carcharodon carcharias]|uniref:nuclear factor NF-kappa-B p100 subunit-like n=1 Tax=Carcharodon carcharias TaxID=13397 RepID=UPI001B7F465E|nr:nuclear factor NF-kappa-B p100 subunit-like [Carcharodon carcharias]XP_041032207.1 nuclear factor NF-kappa-B p100 subunit-like [Carcharodon carcharias]